MRGILILMKLSRAILVISLALVVLFLYVAGLILEFHWRMGWYDHVVHTLAGAMASLAIFSLYAMRAITKRPGALFAGAFLVSLVVGTLWEIFELRAGITSFSHRGYAVDTALDIVFDIVGGWLAAGYILIFK